jgi:glycosyltransferase involved in cell wall biosynthesis
MIKQPMVSIVIPVYNGADFLSQAVESALAQTYPCKEVIVINDGSTDDGKTDRMARSFGDKIRYFVKENGGVASALNRGIVEMHGEYFSWLSHDDIYHQDKIHVQIDYLRRIGCTETISFCGVKIIDSSNRLVSKPNYDLRFLRNTGLAILATYINGCSLLVPAAAFQNVGYFDESLKTVQDNDMWLRLYVAGFSFAYIPRRLVLSRQHMQQTSNLMMDIHKDEKESFYIRSLERLGTEVFDYAEELAGILIGKGTRQAYGVLNIMLSRKKNFI